MRRCRAKSDAPPCWLRRRMRRSRMDIDTALLPDGWELATQPDGFPALIGPLLLRRDPAGNALGIRIGPQHLNLRGAVHGGLIASLADHALGMQAWDACGGQPCVTLQLGLQYIGAGRSGDLLEARGEVVRMTRSVVFMRGLVVAADRVVAAVDGVWKRLGT